MIDVSPKRTGRRYTTSGTIETNPAFNPVTQGTVTGKRQTTVGIANMPLKRIDRRHTTSENVDTHSAYDSLAVSDFAEERHTAGDNSSAASNNNAPQRTIDGIADTNISPNRRVASEVATQRQLTDGTIEMVPEVNKQGRAVGLEAETSSKNNNKRHTIGDVPRAVSEVNNKRHTTG